MPLLGRPNRSRSIVRTLFATAAAWLSCKALAAPAIPLFSQQYEVSCAKCHSVIPHLNAFGAAFMGGGDRIPGLRAGPGFPFSAKLNVVDSSRRQGDGSDGAGLPKAIVDEVELFTSGTIGARATYFVEQYLVDGGARGLTRDAWVSERINPWNARIPIYVQAGAFTLPLPVDPESFRDSYQGYAPYEQTVGTNTFNFFNPKIGIRLGIGDAVRGLNLQLFTGPGHDRQSGLASRGTDALVEVQDNVGPLALTAFRYDGERPTPFGTNDAFERTGYGVVWNQWGRLSSESVLLRGRDAQCGFVANAGCTSGGGFTQLRYQFNRRSYVSGRYEGTNDSTGVLSRDAVLLAGYAPSECLRVTIEDVVAHIPQTTNTLNLQLTIAR